VIAVSERSSFDSERPDRPGASIDDIKEAGSAFDGYRQIIRSGTARRSSVEQNHGAAISDRVTGDAGAQIVGDVCEPAGDRLERDLCLAATGPPIAPARIPSAGENPPWQDDVPELQQSLR
jgi:hypothetical protein